MSLRSPKLPFVVRIDFVKPLKNLGSVEHFTAETLEKAEKLGISECKRLKSNATITILQNKKVYPEHEWVTVKRFDLLYKRY